MATVNRVFIERVGVLLTLWMCSSVCVCCCWSRSHDLRFRPAVWGLSCQPHTLMTMEDRDSWCQNFWLCFWDRLISARDLHLSDGIVLLRLFPKQPPTVADVIHKRWKAALFQSSFFLPLSVTEVISAVASPPMRKRRPATYCIRPLFQQQPSTPMIQPKRMMATAMPMKPAVILLRSEKTSQCQVHFLSNLYRRSAGPRTISASP